MSTAFSPERIAVQPGDGRSVLMSMSFVGCTVRVSMWINAAHAVRPQLVAAVVVAARPQGRPLDRGVAVDQVRTFDQARAASALAHGRARRRRRRDLDGSLVPFRVGDHRELFLSEAAIEFVEK